MGTCSNSAATQRWVGQSTCDTGVSHGTLSTILGSTICGFTNRAYTFLLHSIMGSSISGTSGSSAFYPGAAWVVWWVGFQNQRRDSTPMPPCSQLGIIFPGMPAKVFACPDWSSAKRPAPQHHWPSHLDLYAEVWGEPCQGEQSSTGVHQQHTVAPCCTQLPPALALCLLPPTESGSIV